MSCPSEYVAFKKYNDLDFLYYDIPLNGEHWLEESIAKKECDKRLECDGLLYNNSNGRFVMRKGMKLNKEFYENPSSTNTFCVKKDMVVNPPKDDSMLFFKSVPHRSFVKKIECDPKTTVLNEDGMCVSTVQKVDCDSSTTILKDGICVSKSNTDNEVMTWPLLIFKLATSSK